MNIIEPASIRFISRPTPEQLQAYYRIRQQGFREVMHWQNFSGAPDAFDRQASFVLALHGGEVVGGARLIVHESGADSGVSLESDGFSLWETFPDLPLSSANYYEVGRLVLAQPYRNPSIVTELVRHIIGMGQILGCRYLFAAAPAPQARYYRKILQGLGIPFIIRATPLPDKPLYEGTAHYLGHSDLNAAPDYRHVVFADS